MMRRVHDMTGQRFTRLLVTATNWSRGQAWCDCKCDCGNTKTIRAAYLRNGLTRSCGCLQRESSRRVGKTSNLTHGMSTTATYRSWASMLSRCTNKNHHAYGRYGGGGISVCDSWRHSFESFISDMGLRPEGKTLDRICNTGNYEPSNCRWASPTQQNRNSRNVRLLTCGGKTQCIAKWADYTGIKSVTIRARLRNGWSVERSLGLE